jgi:hypothetical protein
MRGDGARSIALVGDGLNADRLLGAAASASVPRRPGQPKPEVAAAFFGRLGLYVAAERLDRPAYDGQTETGAVLAGTASAEGLEEDAQLLLGQARQLS